MRQIKLQRLELHNFKCHDQLKLEMAGGNVRISGDNGTGKTSVYDSLTWLLFGRDSAGNGEKIVEVKPLGPEGLRDHDAVTSVEGELTVDGQPVTLRRECRELWKTRNGVRVFEGNGYDYYVDGVPMKKSAYEQRIRELVPEEVFQLLTSVRYFAYDMKWQQRRSVLFDMAGRVSDRELMEREARFRPLLADMGKRSPEDYRAWLVNRKKGLAVTRDDAPARISECERTLQALGNPDFEAEEKKLKQLLKQQNLGVEAQLEALEMRNRLWNQEQSQLGRQLEQQRIALEQAAKEAQRCREGAERCGAEAERLRQAWIEKNQQGFAGAVCPTCGQSLPFDQLMTATRRYETQKRHQLDLLEEQARQQDQERDRLEARLAQLDSQIPELETLCRELEARRVPGEMPGYEAEKAALSGAGQDPRQLRQEIERCRGELAKRELIERTQSRIDQLRQEGQRAAQEMEQVEAMLALLEEFVRFKAGFAEESVNQLFSMARFRLFKTCANGSLEERCDVVWQGVPWLNLNQGARVNVGIDLINRLSEHYGVRVPLFIDNAESVTRILPTESQVIRLVVREGDKKLRMEAE